MLPLKPLYNRLHFINILLSPNSYTFSDAEQLLHPYLIFSALLNLNFLTWRTPKFKVPQILPGTLSTTQSEPKEPKRSQIDSHLDYETAVHIPLEDPACRWFDLAHTDLAHFFQKLTNCATHLTSPEKKNCIVWWYHKQVGISGETVPEGRNFHIYYVQAWHLVSGSNIWGWCVTPHSSPARGCWHQKTIFNILNIFTIN